MAGQKITLTLLTPSWPARGCGRPATSSKSVRPACFLALCPFQLWGNIPQIFSVSGGYFVGEFCPPSPPPLHSILNPYNQLVAFFVRVRKTLLQSSIVNSIFFPLNSSKNPKSLTFIPSTPPCSTTTTSPPAARKVSRRQKKLQIHPRSNKSLNLQG